MKYIFTMLLCLGAWCSWSQEVWTQKENFPTVNGIAGRDYFASFAIGDKVYVGMGQASYSNGCNSSGTRQYTDWYAYTPASNTWARIADFPGDYRNVGYVSFSIGNKGYFGLGYANGNFASDFWEYDPALDVWTKKSDFPYRSYQAVGYAIGEKGYVVGGMIYDNLNNFIDEEKQRNYEYDPATDNWIRKADLPSGLSSATGFAIGDKGYIGLGIGASGYSTEFFSYNTTTDSWSQIANYPKQSKQRAIGFSLGNLGYVIGGDNGVIADRKELYSYDPAADAWTLKQSYPGNFQNQNISGGNNQNVVNNKFYYGLGHVSTLSVVCGTYSYSYSCGSWWSSSTCYSYYNVYNYTFTYSNQWWEFALPLSITTGTVNTSLCQGTSFDVPFTKDGELADGNIFTAQLSDANGSFSNPVNIGTLADTTNGIIRATLPINITGTGYRVRVVSSSPSANGTDNGSPITINALPVPGFQLNNAAVCFGQVSEFTNATTGAATYNWNLGNGTSLTSSHIQHTYAAPGIYDIKLIATSPEGCIDSLTKSVTVNPKPTAAYSIPKSEQCVNGNSFEFKNESTTSSGVLTYAWTFGDGNTSTLKDPTHVYSAAGSYGVRLIVTNDKSCSDTISKTVTVFPKPTPAFTINDANQCVEGNKFVLTNTSTLATGVMSYKWNFGDGNTSGNANPIPIHSYTSAGNYTIKLVVVTDKGCSDSTSQTVTVNPKPTAAFEINNLAQCVNGNNFSFTNKSTIASGTMNYLWSFGDGAGSSVKDPSHVYANAGTYSVQLIVTSGEGCKDTLVQSIQVYPKPTIDFTLNDPTQCITGNDVVLNNISAITAGTISYNWNFGDGNTSTSINESHSYSTSGNYNIKLVGISDKGCSDSISKPVTIYPKPVVAFSVNENEQCVDGNSFSFQNSSTIASGTMNYSWNFGDGNLSTASNPSHSYSTPGTYTVKLVATSAFGCKDSLTKQVTIYPKPVAAFSVGNNAQCISGNEFVFTNSSTISAGTLSYSWNFGDGNSSSSTNPTHKYSNPGNYTVRLIVLSDKGCTDTIQSNVTVYPKPAPSFTVSDADQCVKGNSFSFTNTTVSTGTLSYTWNMGDGKTYTSKDVTHSYASAGSYTITITAENEFGCSEIFTRIVSVNPEPVAGFSVNSANQCLKDNNYQFSNSSSISSGTMNYLWNFGDGKTSSSVNPSHVYATSGTYTVTLKVTSEKGCINSFTSTVTVYDKPSASFTIADDDQCLDGNNFRLNNTSVNNSLVQFNWIFGDGTNSDTQNPNKRYLSAGVYNILLFAKNVAGCASDTARRQVLVHPEPVVNAGADQLVLEGKSITLNATASGNDLQYLWTPGRFQMSSSTASQLVIEPKEDISYTLTVTGIGGCRTSDQVMIRVLKKPVIPNVFSPNGDGINDVWDIKYLAAYPGATVDVFNRGGQMIFRSQGYTTPWNGTYKGNPLPVGTYYYVIDPKNGREKISGSITILK